MTLGLGDPLDATFSMAEAKLILGRQIKEPSLYVRSGVAQPSVFVAGTGPYVGTAGGGDGAGSGSSGGEASSPDGNAGSGNNGGDGDGP